MNENVRNFLARAASLALTSEERSVIREQLTVECSMVTVAQHLEHAAAGVKLSPVEKAETLGKILKGMRKGIRVEKKDRNEGWILWLLRERTFATSIAAVFLVFAGGGSITAAAEASVPGDFLYPIKMHVIERVRSGMNRTTEDQDEWRIARLRRRLREAETLSKRQNVSKSQWQEVSTKIEEELGKVEVQISQPLPVKKPQEKPNEPGREQLAQPAPISVDRNLILRERVRHVLKEDGREILKLQRAPEKRREIRPVVDIIRRHSEFLGESEARVEGDSKLDVESEADRKRIDLPDLLKEEKNEEKQEAKVEPKEDVRIEVEYE